MRLDGFIGESYTALALTADQERLVNLLPEKLEGSRLQVVLLNTPGLSTFCTVDDAPHRGSFAQDGRAFVVAGAYLYEILSDGTTVTRGAVTTGTSPVTIASNGTAGHQLFLTVSGTGWIFDLSTNTLTAIAAAEFPSDVLAGDFLDGYFLAITPRGFQFSALENGLSWDGADIVLRSTTADAITAGKVAHGQLYLFGSETSEAWYPSTDPTDPFLPYPGSQMQQGAVMGTVAECDNTVFWVGQNRQGAGVAYRADGYTPRRISTHAVELAWQGYPTLSDARSWSYDANGHAFYVVTFPTAGHTWVYDASLTWWHERMYRHPTTGAEEAHRAVTHCYAFGRHLVGDRVDGRLYTLSETVYTDAGDPIVRIRQAPHLTDEHRQMFYNRFELYLETGLGLSTGQGSSPMVMLSWSDDAGHTFGNEHQMAVGPQGQYRTRAYLTKLGRSRDRVFRVTLSDPIPARWCDAFLDVSPGA